MVRVIGTSSHMGSYVTCAVIKMHESLKARCVSTESDDSAASQWAVPCFQKLFCIAIACFNDTIRIGRDTGTT
jgi:ribosomal protein S26